MKVDRIKGEAAAIYEGGLSIEQVANELGTCYRTARKAIFLGGAHLRDPSTRLIGRTRPDKKALAPPASPCCFGTHVGDRVDP
jgi:hypothetical protein